MGISSKTARALRRRPTVLIFFSSDLETVKLRCDSEWVETVDKIRRLGEAGWCLSIVSRGELWVGTAVGAINFWKREIEIERDQHGAALVLVDSTDDLAFISIIS